MTSIPRVRSVLSVPGDQADSLAKAPLAEPDVVLMDLTDAVPLAGKEEARTIVHDAATVLATEHPGVVIFTKVNAMDTPWFHDDLAGLHPHIAGVVVPRVSTPEGMGVLREELAGYDRGHLGIVVGLETVSGVERASDILATAGVVGCYFGANNYVTDIGGLRTTGNTEVLFPRSRVAAAASMTGVFAIDQAVASLDPHTFRSDVLQGRAVGFDGKLCNSEQQVSAANEVYTPSVDEVTRAQLLIEAFQAATSQGDEVLDFHGQIVDAKAAERAKAILVRAGHSVEAEDGTVP